MCLAFFIESHGFDSEPTQPKKAHQGGNAQVESYLSDPRKGTVWYGIDRSRLEGTTAREDEPVRPRGVRV